MEYQKTAKATGDLIGNKIAKLQYGQRPQLRKLRLTMVKLRKSQEVPRKIIQKQLQMNMKKKYLEKDIYLQNENY